MEDTAGFKKRDKTETEIAEEELQKELEEIVSMDPEKLQALLYRAQLRSADALEEIAGCLGEIIDRLPSGD